MFRKLTAIFSALFLVFTLSLAMPLDSDAARMGGGRSFGSQPSMRAPAQSSAVQQRTQQAAPNRQAAAQQQQPKHTLPAQFGEFGPQKVSQCPHPL